MSMPFGLKGEYARSNAVTLDRDKAKPSYRAVSAQMSSLSKRGKDGDGNA